MIGGKEKEQTMTWIGSFLVVLGFLGMGRVAIEDKRMMLPVYSFIAGIAIVDAEFRTCPPDSLETIELTVVE